MASCPSCGFDPSSVSPSDAVVALRSFPRRYRELAGPAPDGVPASDREHAEHRWEAVVTEAGQAAEAIAALAEDLRRTLIDDRPRLTTTAEMATAVRNGGDPATAFDRLQAACEAAAGLADHQPGEAWAREATRPDGPVTAIDVLRDAVHAGIHHLRQAQAEVD
mgnify:CR=1 FL=1